MKLRSRSELVPSCWARWISFCAVETVSGRMGGSKAGENTSWRFPNALWRSVRLALLWPEMCCERLHRQRSEGGRRLGRTVAGLQDGMKWERRRLQVFRAQRGCGPPVLLKTREERAEARARAAVNATRLSPEDDWQYCDEYYSEAEENAYGFDHAKLTRRKKP